MFWELTIGAAVLLGLAVLAIYAAGWDIFVFGIGVAVAYLGGWWVAVGAGIAVAQGARLARRRWQDQLGSGHTPV